MKTRTLLIAAVMFLGLTAASFAQATFSVGSIPVTAVVNTGQVELTGTVTFTLISGTTATNGGTITISYGVPITYPDLNDVLAGNGIAKITIVGTGGFNTSAVTVNASASNNASGLLVLNIPGNVAFDPAVSSSFSVSGVRVAVAASGLTNLTASLSATNNAITAGQTSVVVISSIQPGINSIKTTTTGSINAVSGGINTGTGCSTTSPCTTAVADAAKITILEGFLNAWGDPTNLTAGGVRITLSGAPPAGVTITFPATATTDGVTPTPNPIFTTINSDGASRGSTYVFTSSSTSLSAFYRATSSTDPTKQETLTIPVQLSVSSSASLPLPSTLITYVVSMAPIGTPFTTTSTSNPNGIVASPAIPRYAALDVGPANLLSITGLTTTMLVPFAQTVTALGFNTGLAISNTTEDPGATVMGFPTATPQSGTMTFFFFPALPSATGTNPTNFSFTPTGTFGHGLDANGKLVAGGTFVALISEILAAANQPTEFNGYIFIVTNFTNAHGFWTVSDFRFFSQGGMMLVLPGTGRTITPEALNN